jgi:uncharacterized membrane protein
MQKFKPSKGLVVAILALGFIGFLDTTYLTITHFTGQNVNCTVSGGCNEVLSSEWSTIFGIPLALLGLLYYSSIIFTTFLYLDSKNEKFFLFHAPATTFGFLFSGFLFYLQYAVIEQWCQYCLVSAATSTVLFLITLPAWKLWRR